MPMMPPKKTSQRLRAVGILAILLALASGWYVVALGWSLAFLLSEGWLMAIYSLILLVSPALFTIVAIQAFRGWPRSAGWFLVLMGIKWLVVFVYSFLEGGWAMLWSNLPIANGITRLADDFLVQYRLDQVVMLIIQFDVEPILLVVMAFLLRKKR